VIDGDTIAINEWRIRLEGIDAPETDQVCLDAKSKRWTCGSSPLTAIRTSSAIASMPHDEVEAAELVPSHLAGPHHRATITTAALCEMRRTASLSQAVANG
jgi:hypothetical protein